MMSSTLEGPNTQVSTNDISLLGYAITLTIGFIMFILIITVAICLCIPPNRRRAYIVGRPVSNMELGPEEDGIDEETLNTYPKLLYSQMIEVSSNDDSEFLSATFASTCSICLGDYKDSDTLRLLPDCGHFFHVKCVDTWLRLHSTCPICRRTPPHRPPSIPVP